MNAKTKRGRGRPPGPAKFQTDVALVKFVRLGADRGIKVEKACEEFRHKHGSKGDSVEQLKRRYEMIASAYPGKVWVDGPGPGDHILRRIYRSPKKEFGPALPGGQLLAWPTRKPSR